MPRRREVTVRKTTVDSKFKDRTVSRFVNTVMKDGKKSLAESIIYGALDIVAEKMKDDPLRVLKKSLDNVKPIVETKSRRVGGANYQVPIEVRPRRSEALGMRWLIFAAGDRPGRTMSERLASELMDAYNHKGAAIKKREDVHRMADANKAFAHYRW